MKGNMFKSKSGVNYLIPFVLVALLYLLWGCAHGMLDVLNKQFQETFHMTKLESGFIQFSTYIGYFVMAIPAGLIMNRFGYKQGIVTGLSLFALGAFAFIPAALIHQPIFFLIALFIIACGLCIIETGAHPYATATGDEKYAAQRINLAAAFNGVGWIIGPLLGGILIFGADANDQMAMAKPYIVVGVAVLLVCLLFFMVKFPEIKPEEDSVSPESPQGSIWKNKGFVFALVAQLLYVGAQTGVGSFFINYVTELDASLTNLQATKMLGYGGMGLFFIGRMSGVGLMKKIAPANLLMLFGSLASLCMLLVVLSLGQISLYALYLTYFLMSIMFPTIFALGVKGMGDQTKKASSYLVMSVGPGGAFFPMLMGLLGKNQMAFGFLMPMFAFLFITWFAWTRRNNR